MKARYVLWPAVVFGALNLTGACSSDSGSATGSGATGGQTGDAGVNTGASSSMGNAAGVGEVGGGSNNEAGNSAGGMTSAVGGSPDGGVVNQTGGAGGFGPVDLCEGKDLNCPDDGNPCTEDECNSDTGECGIPRTDTACDDNVYCNGTDLCDAGKCTQHSGNPCATHTCDEPGKSCQCAGKEDCSADQLGDWGECAYASECATTAKQARPVTSYTCNVQSGKCEGKPTVEMQDCARETQGLSCTSNNLICDGAETCKNGTCSPANLNPCQGNAAGNYCSENATYTCGVCSGKKAGGGYPGCTGTQSCCLTSGAWACQASTCKLTLPALAIKPATLPAAAIKGMPAAVPLE